MLHVCFSKKKKHIALKKKCVGFFLFTARGGFTIHVEIFVTHFFRARSRARSIFRPQLRQAAKALAIWAGRGGTKKNHPLLASPLLRAPPRFSASSRDLGEVSAFLSFFFKKILSSSLLRFFARPRRSLRSFFSQLFLAFFSLEVCCWSSFRFSFTSSLTAKAVGRLPFFL